MNRSDPIASSSPASQNRRDLLVALGAAVALHLFAGCAAPLPGAAQPTGEGREKPGFAEPPQVTQRRVALVLSGSGARGFTHLGVLRVLERERWRPDLVVGTSAGAIVGAMYASGLSVTEIESAAATLEWSVLFDFDPVRSLLGGIGLGIVLGERLEKFLRRHLSVTHRALPQAHRRGRRRHGTKQGRRAQSRGRSPRSPRSPRGPRVLRGAGSVSAGACRRPAPGRLAGGQSPAGADGAQPQRCACSP